MINSTPTRNITCAGFMKNGSRLLRCLVGVLLFFTLFSNNLMGQGPPVVFETTLDNYTGMWSNNGSWESGTSPGTANLNDNVNVYGYITRFGDLSFNNGNLHIFDTLVIYGNLTLGNNADLFLAAGAILIVHGDVYSGNQVEVESGGTIIVTGTWTMDGANNQGSFDNDGQLYIFDPGDGLKDGDGYEDISCEDCVLGFDDLIGSDIGDFFLGGSYTITASGPTTFCAGESVTLSTTDTATNYQWYEDGLLISGATTDTYVATSTGSYHVEFDITFNGITQSFSTSAVTVTVNALPPAPTITPVGANTICPGSTLTLTSSIGNGYLWSTGETTQTIDVNANGDYTVQITDANGCLSAVSAATTITVEDVTAPVPDIATLSDVTAECSVATLTAPTATDNCDGAITGTHNVTLPITTQGTTLVTWTYTDAANNSSTQTQNVVINDITTPVISGCPSDITITADDEYCGNTATWTAPIATDNCNVTLTSTHNPGDFFDVGTTTVTYTAEDDAGNTATCSFDVIVQLPAGPVITGETELCTPVETTYSIAPVAGKSYLWTATDGVINGSDSGTEVSIIWSGNTTGTVTATLTSGSGCTVSSTENIIQHETPLTGENQSSGKLTRR